MRAVLLFGTDEVAKTAFLEELLQSSRPLLTHHFGGERIVGIEDAREIKRRAALSPGDGVQAFVVKRADEMTAEAYQAFLKLLEETPDGSFFILLASSPSMPATILSRVEKCPFFGNADDKSPSYLLGVVSDARTVLESEIRKTNTVPRESLARTHRAVAILHLLHTSRVSGHSIDEYTRATLE